MCQGSWLILLPIDGLVMKQIYRTALIVFLMAGMLALSACGFELRGDYELDNKLGKTWLQLGDEYSAFNRKLTRSMERAGVTLVTSPELADSIIEVDRAAYTREVLSIGNDARVREFRLQLEVEFRVMPGKASQPTEAEGAVVEAEVSPRLDIQVLRQQRDLRFDAGRVLATSREEEFMREDMSTTMVRLFMQRLGQLESIR